ncbi:MAG TPA: response regulator transcription factor [Chloroflexota bacterium]|nr:response regulator transcription factor [Chloroflexota bacterium]
MQARVLVVDDEADIRSSVTRGLQAQDFDVETAVDGIDGLAKIERWRPDVVLMDLAMPRMGGIRAIQELRTWSEVPVIVLSVMGEEEEKVRALDVGADDYLTKPFGIQELAARIRVALRHLSQPTTDTVRQLGDVSVDLGNRSVRLNGDEVHLSPIEYELLKHLVVNAGRVLTHGQLLERVWGPEYRAETAYLRPIVTALRKKLGPHFIRTEPGVGYRVPLDTA